MIRPGDLITGALYALRANKLRSGLTTLGIVIGVGAVILLIAIGQGATRQIEATVQGLGTNMLVVTPGAATAGGVSQGARSFSWSSPQRASIPIRTSSFATDVKRSLSLALR